ncbi:hypothetical protein llap_12164 [Limosa lapponica baueri]|uniref:Uncharacterized protein n=1 Tax=Limosa lapponica baueri TaxID=1758121 RepID=A0A2I0TUY9_LIMLA|nr:hypothetical protein llap_12164 [Limosa lapponica baueri]
MAFQSGKTCNKKEVHTELTLLSCLTPWTTSLPGLLDTGSDDRTVRLRSSTGTLSDARGMSYKMVSKTVLKSLYVASSLGRREDSWRKLLNALGLQVQNPSIMKVIKPS